MPRKASTSTEWLANHFVKYLFDDYKGSQHVRRVATWIGFLLKAAEGLPAKDMRLSRTRQIAFDYKARRFNARYNHAAGGRGGIEFVEVLRGRGAPRGETVMLVTNLDEAEAAYEGVLRRRFAAFVKSRPVHLK